jgi:phage terminase small subunit
MAENIEMPQEVASDPVQAAIWEQLTARRTFAQEDAPTLALLCYWHAVANQAREAMALGGNEIEILDATAYKPIRGKGGKRLKMMRKNPALTVLKEASTEIRALSDQLGLSKSARNVTVQQARSASAHGKLLTLMFDDRETRAKAAGA